LAPLVTVHSGDTAEVAQTPLTSLYACAVDGGAPRTGISAFVGRELTLASTGDARFELRGDRTVVGTLESPREGVANAAAVDGRWWLANHRGSEIDAGLEGSESAIARYRPATAGGGILRLEQGSNYRLRPPVIGDRFTLRRRRTRTSVAEIERTDFYTVHLADSAADEQQLSLLVLLALQALILEEAMPPGPGASGY
jgi:hypothetical protein